MDSALLATKFRVPPMTGRPVHRARLIDLLERRVPDYKLTLVSAPAGFGKTTLLCQWAHSTHLRVAWLSLGQEDNDLGRVLRYLLSAWKSIQPDIRGSPADLLLESFELRKDAILPSIINVASEQTDHTVFVLDDFHQITDPDVHSAVTYLIDNAPPTLHFVLSSRAEPHIPLARYRAREEMCEVHAEDLGFSIEESEEFFTRRLKPGLPPADIATLHDRLEGWPTGLHLVALSLGAKRRAPDDLNISGRHRFIADYLAQDVLANLPDDIQQFLIRTSILNGLHHGLCCATTGDAGARKYLDFLERENLFLTPVDDNREWYRYHPVFAQFLQNELERRLPDETSGLHRRAATWCLQNGLADPAFSHAMAANDADIAVQVCERFVLAKLTCGELRVVFHWLSTMPPEWFQTYPVLGLAKAGYHAYSGGFLECVACVDSVDELLASRTDIEDRRTLQAQVSAVRCFVACVLNDLPLAEQYGFFALRELPAGDTGFRAGIHQALGDTYRQNRCWDQAKNQYLQVFQMPDEPSFGARSAHVFGALADLDLRKGSLRKAEKNWRSALAAIEHPDNYGHLPVPVIGWVYVRLAELLYEYNDLMATRELLAQGLERSELGGDTRSLVAGYLLTCRLHLTDGKLAAANVYLDRARQLLAQAGFPEWMSRFDRLQVELWLAQDKLRAAVDWADSAQQTDDLMTRPDSDPTRLALVRVLIMKGDEASHERALELIDGLPGAAEDDRSAAVIESLALTAIAQSSAGNRTDALSALESALRMAEPEGYIRLLADLGMPIVWLLHEAHSRNVFPDYIESILAACGETVDPKSGQPAKLPEPLSRREKDVLTLVAAGLTNSEIAESLVISRETVKKHTSSIYGKLGVSHRAAAVARARALELLN